MRSRAWFVSPALAGLSLVCCTPDFDALSRGSGDLNAAGALGSAGLGGVAGSGGVLSAAGASAGSAARAGDGGSAPAVGGTAGSLATAGSLESAGSLASAGSSNGGNGTGGNGNAGSGSGPEAGAAGESSCSFSAASSVYIGFEAGSEKGFTQVTYDASAGTSHGTTVSAAIVAGEGVTCPGAFELTANFKAYGVDSGSETATGTVYFAASAWTNAVTLHAMVKVTSQNSADPMFRHLSGVQLFVMSGNYFYTSQFDTSIFRNGQWNEMVVALKGNSSFDPSSVFRFGIQGLLVGAPNGTPPAGAPAVPPTTHFFLDDVWVEFP